MINAVILIIMAGCAAALFKKGTMIKSFGMFISALCASFVALWWYEALSELLIKQEIFVDAAPAVCFGLLFVIAFAILQTAVMTINKQKIDFGFMPEKVGRIVFGLLLGYVISGVVLIGGAMAPLPDGYPYPRFDSARPDIKRPAKTLLNPDGFIAGFFSIISSGSVSGSQSFGVLHAGFIDELYLNRLNPSAKTRVESSSITTPAKNAAWPAPAGLKDIPAAADSDMVIARVGFGGKITTEGSLAVSQVRFMCKKKGDKARLDGSAVLIYPVGYMTGESQAKSVGAKDTIPLNAKDAKDGVTWINFVLAVPKDYEPVAAGIRSNVIVEIAPMSSPDQTFK